MLVRPPMQMLVTFNSASSSEPTFNLMFCAMLVLITVGDISQSTYKDSTDVIKALRETKIKSVGITSHVRHCVQMQSAEEKWGNA